MKMLMSAAAFAGAMIAGQVAEAAQVRWVGYLVIRDSKGTCDYNPAGERYVARFRLPISGSDNGDATSLALLGQESAQSFRLNSGKVTNKFKKVDGGGVGNNVFMYENDVSMRFTRQDPEKIVADTDFIIIEGEIKGYDDMEKCTIVFDATFTRRPN